MIWKKSWKKAENLNNSFEYWKHHPLKSSFDGASTKTSRASWTGVAVTVTPVTVKNGSDRVRKKPRCVLSRSWEDAAAEGSKLGRQAREPVLVVWESHQIRKRVKKWKWSALWVAFAGELSDALDKEKSSNARWKIDEIRLLSGKNFDYILSFTWKCIL